jgi:hypothetical protein
MTRTLPIALIALIALCTTLMITTTALAQGTATSSSTFHLADNAGIAYAGGPLDLINGPGPFPIDLDSTGGPWRKSISSDPAAGFIGTGSFTMIETIQNVGTEPWYDWHEQLYPGGIGVTFTGAGVTSITVNGNPITFNQVFVSGTMDLDTFSQPVLPGDVMVIEKDITTTSNVVGPGKTLFLIDEYPTPEPGSAALMGTGALLVLRRIRQRAV